MGIIDRKETILTCTVCKITETLTASEYGSSYGSSGWDIFSNSKYFVVESIGEDLGPIVTSAKCKKCTRDVVV